ncbi:response regulator transcription factor [Tenacibaculum finnmarkense genomovar finnmarkense]|uniref:Response regulator n=1 Tax=Tenacibaculum finnmarkense genomovar finnmarkense TaxID=1458503 RepID=A0AAP1RFD5_9FLAO|nr:LytTR family DNA-binding domain-containing protein [Tenacibaculum finnmarkense]MBE7653014.1 response regulator [Tenacibaculum finnmarkense genomovar finnmarkense]MBE7693289.1 response regulator [Tenacibaculum finnmarkense genomovar finnmarkense]MBE7695315.1 response regulator [Tenacibaculum finnmarkense genomovar finnmarkense]MCD8413555.1 LytTR family DNA-binding domain-containing protein [Tenacibaculum finnmarkense genomovar ulcerans]MCD8417806.1 LytTR family DNA-binding domain-containing 
MQKLTAIIVDDMPSALEMLQNDILTHHQEIEIIGTAKSVVEAAILLQKLQPDILFLDIMLGDGTGFDVLEIHPNLTSKVIFVTASDEFAIKAFKFAAIDYILKPYSNDDLSTAIDKAKNQIKPAVEQLSVLQESIKQPNLRPKKISLNTTDKIVVVNLDDIVRCKSDNNYTEFFFIDGQHLLVSKTLKYFADMLKEFNFIRIHQSHLVNIQYIKEFIKSDGGYLVLKNKITVPVSVRKRNEVITLLGKI